VADRFIGRLRMMGYCASTPATCVLALVADLRQERARPADARAGIEPHPQPGAADESLAGNLAEALLPILGLEDRRLDSLAERGEGVGADGEQPLQRSGQRVAAIVEEGIPAEGAARDLRHQLEFARLALHQRTDDAAHGHPRHVAGQQQRALELRRGHRPAADEVLQEPQHLRAGRAMSLSSLTAPIRPSITESRISFPPSTGRKAAAAETKG
jgi:hypothetical protein